MSSKLRSTRRYLAIFACLGVVITSILIFRRNSSVASEEIGIAAVEKAGGIVRFDWQPISGDYDGRVLPIYSDEERNGSPVAPQWLRRLVGDRWFQRVERVTLSGSAAQDNAVEQLWRFTELKTLYMPYAAISDEEMRSICKVTSLERLDFSKSKITDGELAHLAALPRLANLSLWYTPITDDGLRHLTGVTSLRDLCLANTRIGDDGMQSVVKLTQLRVLNLEETKITDAGLAEVRRLPALEDLYIGGTKVSDNEINVVQAAMPNLRISR
jgi:hypothetical protein